MYFNNDVFEDIERSKATRENGKIYINHPYIAKVRKLVNAYSDKDLDEMGTSTGTFEVLKYWDANRDKAFTEKVIKKFTDVHPEWPDAHQTVVQLPS